MLSEDAVENVNYKLPNLMAYISHM